ncbi:DUF2989 domain-containing protein [Alteromonas sp. ASW11-130]|uniref:DUF2989 domain-containing protein n=1 Tax=Alteromonas sp. ASW11-130 TaxID=3015775 RepID=UPI0022429F0E|nr:DUF2989 domain-containing protein [Alteromonas sp. ASW11-130]MCW8092079.1 DUF2989 domain-containing protein [Alteromonas sp. ASW11-130]
MFPILCIYLTGCGEYFSPKVSEICSTHPNLCSDLNSDSWCRSEKAEIVNHRYRHREPLTAKQQYRLLILFEDYRACITKAAGIEHIKYREKESDRMKGVITAKRELKRLARATKNDPNPYLSYYHWSRFSDDNALQRFMNANRTGKLNTPDLLVALATIEVKHDLNQTRKTLYRALSLYENDDGIDTEVFPTLVTISLEQEKYARAYVWSIVAEEYDALIEGNDRTAWAKRFNLDTDKLEDVADEVIDALEDGSFNATNLGLHKI